MEWADSKTIFTIFHIFGAVIGAGGAFASDLMFFLSVKDKRLSKVELAFMRIGSKMVWVGLGILALSGIVLFLHSPAQYMASSKFLAKMTIVAVIIMNGVVFHTIHLPRFHRHSDHHFPSSDEFVRTSPYIMASGALSVLSWSWALILGSLHGLPYSYPVIITAYLITVGIAVSAALVIRKRFLGIDK